MSLSIRDSTVAYITCLIELGQKVNKSTYRKAFNTSLSCLDLNNTISEQYVNSADLPCQLLCNIGDLLPEPNEGAVGFCTGTLYDSGNSTGLKINVTNVNE